MSAAQLARPVCRTIVCLLLVFLLPRAAPSEPSVRDAPLRARMQRRTGARAAVRALERIHLNRQQILQLAPILDQAARIYVEQYLDEARRLPELIDAFSTFEQQDAANLGFSRDVQGRTARLNHQLKEAREAFARRVVELERRALAVLTPRQRELLLGRRPTRSRPVDPMQSLQQQLRQITLARDPRPGPAARVLFNPAAMMRFCQIAGSPPSAAIRQAAAVYQRGTDEYPRERFEQQRAELARLRDRISNWNLINGLYLSREQINQIVELYDRTIAGNPLAYQPRSRPAQQRLHEVELELERILNSGQVTVVREFKPCLIPPKNLRDPVRVGQANDHSAAERLIERLRRTPPQRLEAVIDRVLEREQDHWGPYGPSHLARRKRTLLAAARKARGMSEADFALAKTDLAKQIEPPDRIREIREKLDELARRRGLAGKLARMMLRPVFVEQLRERAEQLERPVVVRGPGLEGGPQAENCEKGCALGSRPKRTKSGKQP